MKISMEEFHDLWKSEVPAKEIADRAGITIKTLYMKVSRLRSEDPDQWPKRNKHKYFNVYICPDCDLRFMVDKNFKEQDDVCCPVCWTNEVEFKYETRTMRG